MKLVRFEVTGNQDVCVNDNFGGPNVDWEDKLKNCY